MTAYAQEALSERIGVLDGAWGTAIQNMGLQSEDYTANFLEGHSKDTTGDPDVLNLTRPDLSIGQADYDLQVWVHDMNVEAAKLARRAADEAEGDRFVAGSIGPMNVTLSLSPKVEDPAYRAVTYQQVYDSYA